MKFSINDKRWYSVNDDLCFEDFFTYKTIHTNKQVTYYQDILAFDIETSSFDEFDEEALLETKDTEVYDHLKGTTIRISQKFYSDIPDFNDIRRSLFGRIWFSKTEGISVDSLYHELSETYPYYFPDDIWNTSDMLEQIVTVFLENSPEREDQDTKRSIMYVWQLAINGTVIIGRTWEEFLQLMDIIFLQCSVFTWHQFTQQPAEFPVKIDHFFIDLSLRKLLRLMLHRQFPEIF